MEDNALLQDRTAFFQEASLPKSGIIQTQNQSSYTLQENGGIGIPNEAKRDREDALMRREEEFKQSQESVGKLRKVNKNLICKMAELKTLNDNLYMRMAQDKQVAERTLQ